MSKTEKTEQTLLQKSLKRAFGGGIAGSAAMVIQVTSLMWLRTTMNYQYRYGGTSMKGALNTLYAEGGVRRFYRGYGAAIALGPLSRFGDTAANTLMMDYLKDKNFSTSVKTFFGSLSAACWRICLMPIDALKTTLQVEGQKGLNLLKEKFKLNGPRVLYYGSMASASATLVGHFPWFFTYNYLSEKIPQEKETVRKLMRSAFIGFNSAVISDCCSNSLRVIKTTRQTSKEKITYGEVIKSIVDKDGYSGLFGRGLKTRIFTNGLQGIIFTIVWNSVKEKFFDKV